MADDNKDALCSRVCYLKDNQGLSLRQIAKELSLSRDKVTALYAGTWNERMPRDFILDPYRDLIVEWFRLIPSLKAVQIWQRLLERKIPVSRHAVEEYTETFRQKKKSKIHWPLTFLPAEEAQVDWFFLAHPILGRLCGFTLILSYSRFAFAHHSFEFFIEGHLMAFAAMNGTPMALRYDNLKSVVIKRQPLTYNAAFLEFANYYGFEIRLYNPASGNEKGRVERLIRSMRDTFENTAAHHQSLSALNQALHDWMREKNNTVHRATEAMPSTKKLEEKLKEKLKSLPVNPYPNIIIHAGKSPTKTGLVIFDTNSYSIPAYCRNETIAVHVRVDRVDFFDGKGKPIAKHPRCFLKRQTLINPLHRSVSQLSERAKRERIYAVMRGLSDAMAVFLDQNAGVGEDAYATAHALFKLLKTESRGVIESLVREAVKRKLPRLKFIMSSLKLTPPEPADAVSPQNQELMALDYEPRSLEDYDVDNDKT